MRKRTKDKLKRHIKVASAIALAVFCMRIKTVIRVCASGIQDSKLVTGTEKLITDATAWLMILSPVVAGLLIIYFCIRRSAADEVDCKKWNNHIMVAVVSCIGAVLGGATLNLIIGYYK